MALRVPVPQAAAVMLPILCLMDLVGLWGYRGRWSRANMRIILPPALVGIALGALAFGLLAEAWIRLVVGLVAVGFTLQHWLGFPSGEAPAEPRRLKGSLWAGVSGFTSFLAHAGGPPLQIYLLPQRMHKTAYVATTVLFFAVVNYVKLVPYAWLGQFDAGNLLTSLVLSPLAPLGMALGMWLHGRVDSELFYRLCYLALLAAGGKLLIDAAAALA